MSKKTNFKETPKIKKTIFEKLYFYFFLILPFIYSDKLIDPVLIPRQLVVTLFVFIIGVLIFNQLIKKKLTRNFLFLKSTFFIMVFAFVIAIIFSSYKSIILSESIYVFSKISVEILFLIVTSYLLIQKQLSLKSLIISIITFSFISVLFIFLQSFKVFLLEDDLFNHINEITATYANKNLVSSILFLTFPFVIYVMKFSKKWKYFSLILSFFILLFIWILQTKAVIIALILFSLIVILFNFIFRAKSSTNPKITILLISFSLLSLSIVTFLNKDKFPNLFSGNTIHTRLLLWNNTTDMIKDNLVFGVGAGNWQIHFPKYGLDKFNTLEVTSGITTYQRPHNDFLWVFSEMGLLGFIPYLLIFIVILYYSYYLIKKQEKSEDRWFSILLFASIIGYVFISFSDFPFERIEHQIILFTIFSIIISQYSLMNNNQAKIDYSTSKNSFFIVSITTLFIVQMIVISNRFKGELHTNRLFTAHKSKNWDAMINEVDEATNYYYTIDPMSTPLLWYKGVSLFTIGKISEAKIVFENGLKIHPYNIHVLNNLGSCYEKLGNHKMAEKNYINALKISSHFEEVILNLSAVYYNSKQYENAYQTIDKCDINSSDPKYRLFLAAILNQKIQSMNNKKINTLELNDLKRINLYFESKKKNINFEHYLQNLI